jgi:DivIVA domain-containing protein
MPRLSPLEIQKHRFSRKWKGLDPTEVGAFLDIAAEGMEELAREKAALEAYIRKLEEENIEHRERERILKETLVSAQRIVKEAEDSSERLTHSALQRSAEIEKAIHELKLQRAGFRLEIQKMLDLFHQALELDRQQDEQDRPLSYLRRNPG